MPTVVRIHPPPPFMSKCGRSSVGRATAFQAVGRGFEPRRPLKSLRSSVVEHFLGKEEVGSSILLEGSTSSYKGFERITHDICLVFLLCLIF
jgi:hypothetical protein